MLKAVDFVNAMHGEGTCSIEIKDAYHNMKEVLDEHPDAVKYAFQDINDIPGIKPADRTRKNKVSGTIKFV